MTMNRFALGSYRVQGSSCESVLNILQKSLVVLDSSGFVIGTLVVAEQSDRLFNFHGSPPFEFMSLGYT